MYIFCRIMYEQIIHLLFADTNNEEVEVTTSEYETEYMYSNSNEEDYVTTSEFYIDQVEGMSK